MPVQGSKSARNSRNARPTPQVLLAQAGVDWRALTVALGDAIRARRRAVGITQQTLGERIGVSVPWIGMLECARGSPSLEMLTLCAAGLETTPGALLSQADLAMGVKPRARASLTELQAELAQLPPEMAEAVCDTVVGLCKALRSTPKD